jgi:hypothetical protein
MRNICSDYDLFAEHYAGISIACRLIRVSKGLSSPRVLASPRLFYGGRAQGSMRQGNLGRTHFHPQLHECLFSKGIFT